MTTLDTATEVCTVCRHSKLEHKERGFKHEYSPPGVGTIGLVKREEQAAPEGPKPQGSVRMTPGGDPILRMALLRKGLITVEDLDNVEAELRATGVAGYEPPQSLAKP